MTIEQPVALIVYAHPEQDSFNRRLFETARSTLSRTHRVVTSDLYAMGFDPRLTAADLGPHAQDGGSFLARWQRATENDALPQDVLAEQRKLLEADLVVFQFPLWWYSVPAILKGWFDRVLTAGFGFDVIDPRTGRSRRYGDGLLAGTRALVVVSFGETAAAVGPRGQSGDLDSVLFGVTHGTLFYTGMEVLRTHTVPLADDLDAERAAAECDRLAARLAGLADDTPVPYRAQRSGDYRPGRVLRAEFAPGRVDLGIHLVAPAGERTEAHDSAAESDVIADPAAG